MSNIKVNLSIYLPVELKLELSKQAKRQDCSLNSLIVRILEQQKEKKGDK